jgi:hypothetical protein
MVHIPDPDDRRSQPIPAQRGRAESGVTDVMAPPGGSAEGTDVMAPPGGAPEGSDVMPDPWRRSDIG